MTDETVDHGPADAEPPVEQQLRTGFHRDLTVLRDDIAALAAMVTENVPRATEVLLNQDLDGADELVKADDEMDARSLALEERCYEVIALQAPVASDLRRVVAALRIIADVERSNDLAVNICKAARRIYGQRLDPRLRGIIQKMGVQAQQLFKEATESYLADDAARASALGDMDEYLDQLQREFVQQIFESHHQGSIDLQVAVQLAVVARFYERIGDHAVNIGERVRYLVTGWVPEHDGAARYAERQAGSDLE